MSWKNAEISPVYKQKHAHDKSNYRPVSILSLLSKPFECIWFEQIGKQTKDILSKYQGGLKKIELTTFITSNVWKSTR